MTQRRLQLVLVLIFLLAAGSHLLAADKRGQQAEAATLIKNARQICDIKTKGSPGFHLRARVKLWPDNRDRKPVEGTYVLDWASPTEWREEIAVPGYQQLRVGGRDKMWTARSAPFQPVSIYELSQLIAVSDRLTLAPDDRLKPPRSKKHEGNAYQCVEVGGLTRLKRQLCFAPEGELVSDESLNDLHVSYEYADYSPWAGRQFPRVMLVREEKSDVVEVHVEELGTAGQLNSSLFVPPAGAVAWDWCDGATPAQLLEKPAPHYPEGAKSKLVGGTVSVYAVIHPDGRLRGLKVVRSAGADLDQATLTALEHWRYVPRKCAGSPIPTETMVDVTYSLRQ